MKISKKVLSMVLCGFIVFGGSQVGLIKAHAATPNNTRATQSNDYWRQKIRFKLRAKWNSLYKSWWTIDLVCGKDGILRLEGPTNIPGNLTFDDRFIMGYRKDGSLENHLSFVFGPSRYASAGDALNRAKILFNQARVKIDDSIFVHGEDWNDTLTFPSYDSVICRTSQNVYDYGYKNIDRYVVGFKATNYGLVERQDMVHIEYRHA